MAFGFSIMDFIPSGLRGLWEPSRNSSDGGNPPQTIGDIFEHQLVIISALCPPHGEKAFLTSAQPFTQNCVEAIASDLKIFGFPIEQEARDTLDERLNLFDRIANGIEGLEEAPEGRNCENSLVKLQFRKSCAEFIEKKWINDAAKNFYDILLLSNRNERVQAAQVWTSQFLNDVSYLGNLKYRYFSKVLYPEEFALLAQKAFADQCNEALKQRMQLIEQNSKWDPQFFERRLETAHKKSQNDPSSLSPEDMATLADAADALSHITSFGKRCHIVECKSELLNACLFNGHTLQQLHRPLVEDAISQMRFTNIFSELDKLEDEYIFAKRDVSESSST